MYSLAFNATDLLNFMLIRLLLIAAGVILVAVVVVVVVMALRRRGKLVSYLEPDDRDKPSR